jgi:5-methylcytosine-specific restriction endonuclease McrA
MSSLRLPPKEYALLVKQVLSRDGYKCRSCFSRNALHVHHIVFRSQQGPDEMWNLLALCSACHDGVHKDVQDGIMGLTLKVIGAGIVAFIRRPGWRPQ